MPRVTVLLPVRDQAATLLRAMQSILEQQWKDFQLLVLDDGSKDGSGEIAEGVRDSRVMVYRGEQAVGLPGILNKGLTLSDSEYIARMDADDWSHPQRLSAQIELLDSRHEVAACGTAVWVVSPDGRRRVRRYPKTHEEIKARLLFENALAHPATVLRRSSLERWKLAYDDRFTKSQDYDLWERLSRVAKLENIGKPYLEYRVQPHTSTRAGVQRDLADKVRLRQLEALGVDATEMQLQLHLGLCNWSAPLVASRANEVEQWLKRLLDANAASGIYEIGAFRAEILTRFRRVCRMISVHGENGWSYWHRASVLRGNGYHPEDYLRLPFWFRAWMRSASNSG